MPLVRPVAEGLVLTESTAAQVNRLGLLDDVARLILHDDPSGNLIRAVEQWGYDHFVFTHVRSMSGSRK